MRKGRFVRVGAASWINSWTSCELLAVGTIGMILLACGEEPSTSQLAQWELPQVTGALSDMRIVRPSTTIAESPADLIIVAPAENHGLGDVFVLEDASRAGRRLNTGANNQPAFAVSVGTLPDRDADGLPEVLCRLPTGDCQVVGSRGDVLTTMRWPPALEPERILALAPSAGSGQVLVHVAGEESGVLVVTRWTDVGTRTTRLFPGDVTDLLPSNWIWFESARVLTERKSGEARKVIVFMRVREGSVVDAPLSKDGCLASVLELNHDGTVGSIVPVDIEGFSERVLIGDCAYLRDGELSSVLASARNQVCAVTASGRVLWYSVAPRTATIIGPPRVIGDAAAVSDTVFAVALAHNTEIDGRLVPTREWYQLGLLGQRRWGGAVGVPNTWSHYQSISGCNDQDGDGFPEVLVLDVESKSDDFVDWPWRDVMASGSRARLLSGGAVWSGIGQ